MVAKKNSKSKNARLDEDGLYNSNDLDLINKINSEGDTEDLGFLALPSEIDHRRVSELMIPDGYYREDSKIVKKGVKVSNEFSKENNSYDKIEVIDSPIGRKTNQTWSSNVDTLKQKLGFSWQKIARKFAILLVVCVLIGVIFVTSVAAMAIQYWNSTPSIERLERDPSQNSVVYARDGKTKIYEFYKEEKRQVIDNIDQIPLSMQLAVVALEDQNYWNVEEDSGIVGIPNVPGIPLKNIAGAARDCLLTIGGNCRGASGISQQLIKNMTGDDERSPDRKLRELFIAVKLNSSQSKSDILLKYLNWIPFGRNSYGVQEASKVYFGREVTAKDTSGKFTLTIPEACYLAAMIQRPSYFETGINKLPEANKLKNQIVDQTVAATNNQNDDITISNKIPSNSIDLETRKDACLTKLNELELPVENQTLRRYIENQDELNKYINTPVVTTTSLAAANEARSRGSVAFVNIPVEDPFPHFREYITAELGKFITDNQLYEGGYDITTTIDPELQRFNEKTLNDNEKLLQGVKANNASSVILDGSTGQILTMVGSLGYNREDIDGKVNIATTPQQAGSSIKPYVYAAAFKNGFNPGTVLVDVQTNWQGYTPRNFDGNFRGPVTMRRALQGSLNIPAVKSIFLSNDNPSTDITSKLDSFFGLTESFGVDFPCVEGASPNNAFTKTNRGIETCKPNEAKGITQEDVDKAYRGRCFLASALGGCELTLISHATGINTMLQEGNLKTATPFLSIKKKSTGEDIYTKVQASDKPVYLVRDADNNTKLLARQMTNVMSDYEARIPEFGSNRSNLELSDKKWRVAAKTGTSNGPRDFWTVGGSPYYTVALWAGKTDNGTMDPKASAGVSVAKIWKQIMEELHKNKEVKNFSTEGLQKVFVRNGTISTDEEGNTQSSGQTELLTPWQITSLNKKSGSVANSTTIDDLKKNDIFKNRTTLIDTSYDINKLDGKLFIDGKTPEILKQSVKCTYLLPEFTSSLWSIPIDNWVAKKPDSYCKIPEASTLISIDPTVTTNIALNPTNFLTFSVAFPDGSGVNATKIVVYKNNILIDTFSSSSLSIPIASLTGSNELKFEITDSLGNTTTKTYPGVNFTI